MSKAFIVMFLIINSCVPMSEEIFKKYNKYGEKFPDYSVSLSNDLVNDTNVSKVAKYTEEEIMKLTTVLNETTADLSSEKYVHGITVYLGNYFIKQHSGEWLMVQSIVDKEVWTPVILYNGMRVNFVKYILEDVEKEEMFFLYEIYAVMASAAEDIDKRKR